eukprot:16277468-Heterocapsa_arctica.AAC.1
MGDCCLFHRAHHLELSDLVPDDQCLFEDGAVDLLQSDLCHLLVCTHGVLDALEPLMDLLYRWL